MKKLISTPALAGKPALCNPLRLLRTAAPLLVSLVFSNAVFGADFEVTSPGFF